MTEERKTRLANVIQQRQFNLGIVLENVHDPHNISAVMRTCDAVGVQELYVLQTQLPAVHRRWGEKSSSSTSKWLTIHSFNDVDICMRALRKKYTKIYATHLTEQSTDLYDMDLTHATAVIFGNEHGGITDAILSHVDGTIIIPQVGVVKSLNISVACAVVLYEAFRQKRLSHHYTFNSQQFLTQKKQLGCIWGIE